LTALLVVASLFAGRSVAGEDVFGPRPRDVASAFFIARSTNKNQVHYGVRLDPECEVVGDKPVFAYWRMLEKRGELEPVLGIEMPAYGLEDQQQIRKNAGGTIVRVKLRPFPDRALFVSVGKAGRGCSATTTTTVAGSDAYLQSIYVKIKWPFGVDYVLLRGITGDGRRVEERLQN
jgi:hypothetical protein